MKPIRKSCASGVGAIALALTTISPAANAEASGRLQSPIQIAAATPAPTTTASTAAAVAISFASRLKSPADVAHSDGDQFALSGPSARFRTPGEYRQDDIRSPWPTKSPVRLRASHDVVEDRPVLGASNARPIAIGSHKTDAGVVEVRSRDASRFFGGAALHVWRNRKHVAGQSWLPVQKGGAVSSAVRADFGVNAVVHADDALSLSLHQPLYADNGAYALSGNHLIDQHMTLLGDSPASTSADRTLALEAVYARTAFKGRGQVSAFVRGQANSTAGQYAAAVHMVGGALSIDF